MNKGVGNIINVSAILVMAKNGDMDAIIAACRKSLVEKAAKERGGNALLKRTKAAHKIFSSIEDYRIPQWGSVIKNMPDGSKVQCFVNSYYAFTLYDELEGIPIGDPEKAIDVCQFVKDVENRKPDMVEAAIDIAAVKAYIMEHNASAKGRYKPPPIYDTGKVSYNAQGIINCFAILGGNIKMYHDENNPASAAFLESENGKAMLLPVTRK